ncbi:hypothetical protein B0H10DRAFT_1948137 [Mycena sp. CBHHK59/15]|nr:hypothetical protein B0H10DRAFT_1948137 [Mycena sp. CBHHK59/15]
MSSTREQRLRDPAPLCSLHQTVSTFASRGKPAHRGVKEGVGCGRSGESGFVHESYSVLPLLLIPLLVAQLACSLVTGFFIPKHIVFVGITFSGYFLICNIYPILSAEAKAKVMRLLLIIAALHALLTIMFQVHYCEVGDWHPEGAARGALVASEHSNVDAAERLCMLSQATLQVLSHTEHDTITETKLMCKCMQAKQRSDAPFEAVPQQQPPQAQPYHTPPSSYMHYSPPLEAQPQPALHKSLLADAGHYQQSSMGAAVFDYRAGYGSPPPAHVNVNEVPTGGACFPLWSTHATPCPLRSSRTCAGVPGEHAAGMQGSMLLQVQGSPPASSGGLATFAEMGFTGAKGGGSAQTIPKLLTD